MDLVLKLREARRMRGLSQKDAARLSGVGQKTISSFETGIRIESLKLAQLQSLLEAYGLTEAEFFGGSIEKAMAPWELDENQIATNRLVDALHTLPKRMERDLVAKFQMMVETLVEVYSRRHEEDVAALQPRHAALSSGVPHPYRSA
ncbi:MAG TPA: helix-turn-helix domain-containing protein [Thermoanaerobaculia bacterium]|nr:helix-turn-helix domain-containing protein [Thermoanaerobaculia bacterium]